MDKDELMSVAVTSAMIRMSEILHIEGKEYLVISRAEVNIQLNKAWNTGIAYARKRYDLDKTEKALIGMVHDKIREEIMGIATVMVDPGTEYQTAYLAGLRRARAIMVAAIGDE